MPAPPKGTYDGDEVERSKRALRRVRLFALVILLMGGAAGIWLLKWIAANP